MNWNALLAVAIIFVSSGLQVWAQDDGMPSRPPVAAPRAQASDALDDGFTAGALRDACAPAAGLDRNARALADQICQSYLRGLTEGLYLQTIVQGSDAGACMPKEGPISPADAKTDILDYLSKNPDAAEREAGVAAVLAIVKAHGCGEE